MSIMRTITFPGDTEPREIQDSRIEILTLSEDGKVTSTPDEIKAMVEDGKLVYLNLDGYFYSINHTLLAVMDEVGFSPTPFALDFGKFIGLNTNIPAYVDAGSILINDDKTISPMSTIESNTDMIQFFLPKIQDNQEHSVLTNMSVSGVHIPVWTPIPVAKENSLGMVKAIEATPEMTEYIGIDDEGQLRVAPSNNIETDETLSLAGYAADAQVVGNKFSEIPFSIEEDGYTKIPGLRPATNISINKESDTKITITSTLESGQNITKQHISEIQLDSNTNRPNKIITNMKTTIGDSTTETLRNECVIEWVGEW